MKILCFGSLNIDHVYNVTHFVTPGETLAAKDYQCFIGGKGLNQSIALARAGSNVHHGGKVGSDGAMLCDALKSAEVETKHIVRDAKQVSGHAMIQVNDTGENCIIIYGGTNQQLTIEEIDHTLSQFEAGDLLLLQNEINHLPHLITQAKHRGLKVIFNAAPFTHSIHAYPIEDVDVLILNQIEALALSQQDDSTPDKILSILAERFPATHCVLTLGKDGAIYADGTQTLHCPAPLVTNIVDTTAAGDTFIGYFVHHAFIQADPIEQALATACQAASLCIMKPGAAESIPHHSELS